MKEIRIYFPGKSLLCIKQNSLKLSQKKKKKKQSSKGFNRKISQHPSLGSDVCVCQGGSQNLKSGLELPPLPLNQPMSSSPFNIFILWLLFAESGRGWCVNVDDNREMGSIQASRAEIIQSQRRDLVGNRFTSQICYLFLFQHAHFLLFSHHVKQIFLRFSTEDDASIESEISLEILPEVVLHEYSCITLSHAHKKNILLHSHVFFFFICSRFSNTWVKLKLM